MRLITWFKKLDKKSKIALFLSLVWLIIVAVELSIGLYQQNVLLVKYGKRVISTVIERKYGRKSNQHVICEYFVNEKRYTTSTIVNYYEYTYNVKVNIGDQLCVIYYPPDPSIARVDLEGCGIIKTAQRVEAEKYYNTAIEKYKAGEYQEAMEAFNKSIELQPDNTDAYNGRGIIKYTLGDYEGAIKEYSKTLELDSTKYKVYCNRGIVRADLKDYKGAINDYSKAIEINSNYADAYYYRALVKYELREIEKSCSDLKKTVELGNKDAEEKIKEYCK